MHVHVYLRGERTVEIEAETINFDTRVPEGHTVPETVNPEPPTLVCKDSKGQIKATFKLDDIVGYRITEGDGLRAS